MPSHSKSDSLLKRNTQYIPGGVVSTNRDVEPRIAFRRGQGALMWDMDGNEYVDFHGAFAPYILGHNHPQVNAAVEKVLHDGASLFGSGTTELEGRLAELICTNISFVESIQILNSGSEATYQALRLARAVTGRDHIIKPQGGYHGWHNDVACNLMTPLEALGPRISPGEYPFRSMSAGIPLQHQELVHIANFNDLASIEWLCERYPIAALITEPILQNIGIVHPLPHYLEGLRALADRYGFLLIFDEVKTGFRHALGGYSTLSGVTPDLVVYGKALANGFPIAVLGGRRELMNRFVDTDPTRRVLLAGTYNAHPVPTAAAIATIECLAANSGKVYEDLERLGARMEAGLASVVSAAGLTAKIARQGSAFCVYFMDHFPVDWHDVAMHHNFAFDARFRRALIDNGIYFFPLPVKQCSISVVHTEAHIDLAVEQAAQALGAAVMA
jgi:glutamate-1-semialdehyde 2,1-aminomutase